MFYEKKGGGACKKMNAVRCPSVSLEWSPCGRFVLTAITAPRLRVDNGFKYPTLSYNNHLICPFRILTYFGEEVGKQQAQVLLEAKWNPVPDGTFTDRPVSPDKRSASNKRDIFSACVLKGLFLVSHQAKQEDTTAAYVPPHLRGKERSAAPVSFSLGHSDDKGGRIGMEVKGPDVPGGTFVSKAAAKNAKRRAKKRAEGHKHTDSLTAEIPTEETHAPPAAVSESPAPIVTQGLSPSEDNSKRIRALKKKLKQIAHLKESLQQGLRHEIWPCLEACSRSRIGKGPAGQDQDRSICLG